MALTELRQAHAILERASNVLLVVPDRASRDAIASMIAFYLYMQTLKERGVDEVSPHHVPTSLQFLPGSSQVLMRPREQAEVTLDIAGPTTAADVRVEPLQGGMRVHIALPAGVNVTKDQLESTVRALPYDAVVVFGAADLEALGEMYTDHTDFFFNTPIINIDHRADNEHYGTVNVVDITAGSVAEVTYELITTMAGDELDPDIATALYAGVVAGTDSFQRPTTTPRSFHVAARLMEHKANREVVIQHLLKTKPLALLKLAGRLYARLRYDAGRQLYWSLLNLRDFSESGATADDVPAAMRELANNISDFSAAFVVSQRLESKPIASEAPAPRYDFYILLGKGLRQRSFDVQQQLEAKAQNGTLQSTIAAGSLEEAEQIALEHLHTIVP